MGTTTGRLTSGFLVLAVVWIAVYWLWEPRRGSAPISFATPPGARAVERPSGPGPSPASAGPSGSPARVTVPPNAGTPPVASTPEPKTQDSPVVKRDPPPTKPPEPVKPQGPGVIEPEFRLHTLTDGETFQTLARKYFGSESYTNTIARANPLMDPRRLRPGRVVRIPVDPANIQGIPTSGSTPAVPDATARVTEYVVQTGDTLSGIAEELLGDSSRADEIYRLNRDVMRSPDELKLGVKLKIPQEPGRGR